MADPSPSPVLGSELTDLLVEARVQEALRQAVGDGTFCVRCIGRAVGKGARDVPNASIGHTITEALGLRPANEDDCAWCEGLFQDIETYVDIVVAELGRIEYDTFVVGTRLHPQLIRKENAILQALVQVAPELAERFEPMRNEMNREVGGRVQGRTGKTVQFDKPDVSVLLDPHFDVVLLTLKSVYLYGRYRKYDRTIPQTRWPCRSCRGHGCKRCDGTGKTYQTSVEELVNEPALAAFGATEGAFHGAGREDIDALMLGTGRPFVIELKEPRYRTPRDPTDADRTLTLEGLEERINAHARPRVEIEGLRVSDKDEVVAIKEAAHDKAYRAHVVAEAPVAREALEEALRTLHGATIEQRTPERVSHRRADLVRKRTVHRVTLASYGHHARAALEGEGEGEIGTRTGTGTEARTVTETATEMDAEAETKTQTQPQTQTNTSTETDAEVETEALEPAGAQGPTDRFTLDILAASGTYIKELVHGDEGRTRPNLAALIGVPMRVAYLDVVGVGSEGDEDGAMDLDRDDEQDPDDDPRPDVDHDADDDQRSHAAAHADQVA